MSKKPKILELEPRIMFDGAMADDFCDTAFGDNDSILNTVSLESEETFKDKKEPTEVVIVDTSVSNYQEIISSIDTDLNIVVLQQGSTLRDIPELLVEYSDIDALHIVSHGGVGTLQVGSQWYDQNNIYDSLEVLEEIGSKLSQAGDILLYGCNIAATEEGQSFVDIISEMASVDVAASDDITGNKRLGGDWELEYRSGIIEAREQEAVSFKGTLAAPTLSTSGSSILTGGGGNAYGTSDFSTILEDNASSNGDQVSTFLNSDAAGGIQGVSITSADNSGGSNWQYSMNGGSSWSNFGTVNAANSRLLDGANANHKIRFVPGSDYNGTSSITYRAWDKSAGSAGQVVDTSTNGGNSAFSVGLVTKTINITAVNDQPDATISNQTVNEDAGAQSIAGFATGINGASQLETGQTFSYAVTNNNNALFSTQPAIASDGRLTFTTATDLYGSATVTVVVQDNGGTANSGSDSRTKTFTITVRSVNDEPGLTLLSGPTVAEDSGSSSTSGFASPTNGATAGESGQTFTYSLSNDNNSLFSTQPAISSSGVLSWNLATNKNGTANVTVTLNDDGGTAYGGDNQVVQTFALTVNEANDAPVIIAGKSARINDHADGSTVATMVVGYNTGTRHFTDEDSNSLFEHVAIVAQTSLGGTWQYNLNGGAGWVNFPTVSGSNALLLESTHSLRYVRASGSESGDATVTFRAWDKSDSASTGRTKDLTNFIPLTVNGDNTSPYSSETAVATVSIDASNDAPVLLASGTSNLNGSGNSFTHKTSFSTISEDNTNNTGRSVSTFSNQDSVSDDENYLADGVRGVAVTSVDNANGAWQYSVNNRSSWVAFGSVSASSARLLDGSNSQHHIRFIPTADYFGSSSLTYRAWDKTTGTAGGTADASSYGGTTAFSQGEVTRSITITSKNDEPTASFQTPPAVNEDEGTQTIANFATPANGATQLEGSQTFSYSVSRASGSSTSLFSVQPAISANGTLTYTPKANANGAVTFNVTVIDNGGTSNSGDDRRTYTNAFTLTVNSINDAPVLTDQTPDLRLNEDPGGSDTGMTISSLLVSGSVTEVSDNVSPGTSSDNTAYEAIAITGTSVSVGTLQYSTNGGNSFTNVGTVSGNSSLLLNSSDRLRLVSPLDFNGSAGSFTFRAWDQTTTASGSSGSKVDTSTNGGTSEFSSFTDTATITVNAVNDEPTASFQTPPAVNEDAGTQTIANFATPANGATQLEGSQSFSYTVSRASGDSTSLFSVQPAISANGALTYTPKANANGAVTFNVTVIDNGGTSYSGDDRRTYTNAFTLTVNSINDAPVLVDQVRTLTIYEDIPLVSNTGSLISSLLASGSVLETNDNVSPGTSSDNTAYEAIAITAVTSLQGTLQYSTDGGSNWTSVGSVSSTSSLLLKADSKLRLLPPTDFNGSAGTVTFRAWDQTTTGSGSVGTKVNTSTNGGVSEFSAATDTINLDVTPVNMAPELRTTNSSVLSGSGNTFTTTNFTTILEDNTTSNGAAVSGFLNADSAEDEELPSGVTGVAITSVDNTNGAWQYSVNGGSSWTAFGSVSTSASRLLDGANANHRIRFVPNTDYNGTSSITYRAWDQTTGTVAQTANTTNTGGANAFSTGLVTKAITVTAVNDQPDVTVSNQTINEDAGAQTVANFATPANGANQLESGETFTYALTNNNNALFSTQPSIATNGTLTYTPTANANGTATVTVVVQDSGGTANGASDTRTRTFSITVNAVNDAPVLSTSGSSVLSGSGNTFTTTNFTTILEDNTTSNGAAVSGFLNADSAEDEELPSGVTGVAITSVDNTNGAWQYSVNGGSSWTAFGSVSTSASRLLDGANANHRIRFVPATDYNGTSSITYRAWDQTTGTVAQTANTTNTGGANAFSTGLVTKAITVTAVNDQPDVSLSSNPRVNEDAGAQTIAGFATPANGATQLESSQTFTYSTSNNSNYLFASQPVVASNGTLTYTPAANANGTATVTVVVQDSGGTASGGVDTRARTFTIDVDGINDAPVLSTSGSSVLSGSGNTFTTTSFTAFLEDNTASNGNAISTFLNSDSATDLELPNGAKGIAVASVDNNNGAWQYSVDGGSNWNGFGVVSASSSRLLDVANANHRIRFVPATDYNGSAAITYRAWDKSAWVAGQTANTTNTGLTTAFSTGLVTKTITVTAVNDRPNVTFTPPPTVNEDPGAQTIVNFATPANGATQLESGETFSYSVTNNNNSFFSVQPAIAANGTLTYTPAANANGTSTVTVTVQDSGGTANSATDTRTKTFAINVTATNDAPVLSTSGSSVLSGSGNTFTTTNFTTILEDNTTSNGNAVSAFLNSASATDPELPNGVTGVAITSVDNTNGAWQYSTDGGSNWVGFGSVSASSSRLLDGANANHRIRFVPATDYNGSASITYRAWDKSAWAAGQTASTTTTGSATAFSTGLVTKTITVTPVNDQPDVTFTPPGRLDEDSGAQTIINFASPANGATQLEGGETFSYALANDNNTLFSVQPTISANGTLTYTPGDNQYGTATVTVTVQDSSGAAYGATDTRTKTFQLLVDPVNDIPVIMSPVAFSLIEGTSKVIPGFTIADDSENSGVTASFSSTNSSLNLTPTGGVSIISGRNGSSSMTLLGSTSALNTALQSLSYRGNTVGSGNINYTFNDGGATGSGGALQVTGVINVTVLPKPITQSGFSSSENGSTQSYNFSNEIGLGNVQMFTIVRQTAEGVANQFKNSIDGLGTFGLSRLSSSSEMGFEGPQFGFSGFGNTFATMTQASVASADFGGIGMATPTNIISQQLSQEGGAGASVGIPQNRNESNLGGALLSPAKDNSDNISRSSFNRNENFQVTSSGFSVAVAPTKAGGTGSGESLAVFNGIGDISISGDGAVSFAIPPNAFSVSNSDAVITLSAGQADGSILPNWIVFDPKTGQFEGEIPADFEGGLSIVVTAIDQNGNEVQTKFEIKADESENLPQSEDQSDLFFRKKNVIKLSLTDNETHPNFSQQLMQGKGFDKIPNQFHIREAVRLLAYAG